MSKITCMHLIIFNSGLLAHLPKASRTNNNKPEAPTTIFMDYGDCLFHSCLSIWKKPQTLGLTEQYRNNTTLHHYVRRASALPLVPSDQVEDAMFNALDDYQTDDPKVTSSNDYMTEHWVD